MNRPYVTLGQIDTRARDRISGENEDSLLTAHHQPVGVVVVADDVQDVGAVRGEHLHRGGPLHRAGQDQGDGSHHQRAIDAKKVEEYLSNHLDNIVIHRLRTNKPLSAADLETLESTLVEIGEEDAIFSTRFSY